MALGFRDDDALVELVTRRISADRRALDLEIPDMRCANCAGRIERALTGLDGVDRIRLNPARHHLALDYDPRRMSLAAVLRTIEGAGYTPVFMAQPEDDPRLRAERRAQLKRLGVAGIAMMQVMMLALPLYTASAEGMDDFWQNVFRWWSLAFTIPVVLYSASPFFRHAAISVREWVAAMRGRSRGVSAGLDMDVPVALAIAVAFAASVAATVRGAGEVYYDSVTMFVFLLLGARFLEQSTRARLARADNWLKHLPQVVARATPSGSERVPLAAIRCDDRILVPAGGHIPVDGIVCEGATRVDEAALTGESRLVEKQTGERVFAGTLNVTTPISVTVTARPLDTRMADIHRLAQRATLEKPAAVVLADRVARWFVAAIVLLAGATWAVWHLFDPARAFEAAVAVLVVSCPCALSLATPAAITAAATALRRVGFVATRPHVIERLARTTHVVFDKTGTLTGGRAELVAVEPLADEHADACLAIARSIEARTTHPLAAALDADTAAVPLATDVRLQPGHGVEGTVGGRRYRLGNAEFAGMTGPASHPELSTFYLSAVDVPNAPPRPLAEFGVRLALREDAGDTIAALSALGVRSEMLTGDAAAPARALSRDLHDIPFTAEATPESKLAHIDALRRAGAVVAMVGDGINDVPGLAAATVSITTADATDLAKATSDAVILSNGIGAIARAIEVARRARRVIRQNLGWAVAYNLASIPLAAIGLIPPWLAALGMSASSLAVTLNAMRLGAATGPRARGTPWKSF
jgi:Cu2+-exporting ATPase